MNIIEFRQELLGRDPATRGAHDTFLAVVYGLPLTVDARALFYNKKLLQAAGVQPPKTWAELRAAAIKMTKRDSSGKLLVSGFALDDVGLFSMWIKQAGGSMLTADGTKTAFNKARRLPRIKPRRLRSE